MKSRDHQREIFLVGPTAIGKSKVAVYLAQHIHAEILSADSMQVYKGFSIATAQPDLSDQLKIPHHLVGFLDPETYFTVAEFLKMAEQKITEVQSRCPYALIVGGSGMYVRILLDGIFDEPNSEKLDKGTIEKTYEQLKRHDPMSAQRIHPNNQRRIERALSFFEKYGIPISQMQHNWEQAQERVFYYGLWMDPKELWSLICKRVDEMIDNGLEQEAIQFLKLQNPSATLRQAIGLSEYADYLNGRLSKQKAIELIKIHSRQLAKRQRTWFKKDNRIHWIKVCPGMTVEEMGQQILDNFYKQKTFLEG